MKFKDDQIEGVEIISLKRFSDERGFLSEMFRSDEMPVDIFPEMGYISYTHKGKLRGPHSHNTQLDRFLCVQGSFKFFLWDNRSNSSTYQNRMIFDVVEELYAVVVVPVGVVHAYQCLNDGLMLNFPNKLFAGKFKKEPIDEVRHEDEKSIFWKDMIGVLNELE